MVTSYQPLIMFCVKLISTFWPLTFGLLKQVMLYLSLFCELNHHTLLPTAVAREQGQEHTSTDAIDDCGLRYLLAARHHVYLMNTLPIRQRAQLQKQGLSPAYFVWAFHSEAEEVIL